MAEITLECSKCGTKSNTKFCPNCGDKIVSMLRSTEEIKEMSRLLRMFNKEVMPGARDNNIAELVTNMMNSIMAETTLSWCLGGEKSPLDLLASGKEDNPKVREFLDVVKLKFKKGEEDGKRDN